MAAAVEEGPVGQNGTDDRDRADPVRVCRGPCRAEAAGEECAVQCAAAGEHGTGALVLGDRRHHPATARGRRQKGGEVTLTVGSRRTCEPNSPT